MPCFHPIEVQIRRKSLYTERMLGAMQTVPCGRCIGCRGEQARQWAVRMMHESRMHEDNAFVTLTYDDKRLPKNAEVIGQDLSRFIARLRKTQERAISWFGCGEYGTITQRPHYHAALFGVEFLDCELGFDSSRPDVWRSKTLTDAWGRGICEGGRVTMASARYIAGYVTKKVRSRDYVRANGVTGELKNPEFARMSLRPAIGRRWIETYWRDVYPRDFVVMEGVEAKPPRYYDKWMDNHHQDVMEEVRQKRCDEAEELSAYTLQAGEAMAKSRTELFARRLGV